MFTGLVEDLGTVEAVDRDGADGVRVTVASPLAGELREATRSRSTASA